jgi:DNA-binding HxlR family transcriptional regulator
MAGAGPSVRIPGRANSGHSDSARRTVRPNRQPKVDHLEQIPRECTARLDQENGRPPQRCSAPHRSVLSQSLPTILRSSNLVRAVCGSSDPMAVRELLTKIGDKWTIILVLSLDLLGGRARFSELERAVPGISQRMPSATLKNLERGGPSYPRAISRSASEPHNANMT